MLTFIVDEFWKVLAYVRQYESVGCTVSYEDAGRGWYRVTVHREK
jgi:hypothetical protein